MQGANSNRFKKFTKMRLSSQEIGTGFGQNFILIKKILGFLKAINENVYQLIFHLF